MIESPHWLDCWTSLPTSNTAYVQLYVENIDSIFKGMICQVSRSVSKVPVHSIEYLCRTNDIENFNYKQYQIFL